MNPWRTIATAVLLTALPEVPLWAADTHIHGQANLTVAVEGAVLTLELRAPADALVGFEHHPQTADEHGALDRLIGLLQQSEELFVPTPDAECRPEAVRLESELFDAEPDPVAAHTIKTSQAREAHADLEVELLFQCARHEELRDLDVNLFQRFPGLKRVQVELTSTKGQRVVELTAEQRKLGW